MRRRPANNKPELGPDPAVALIHSFWNRLGELTVVPRRVTFFSVLHPRDERFRSSGAQASSRVTSTYATSHGKELLHDQSWFRVRFESDRLKHPLHVVQIDKRTSFDASLQILTPVVGNRQGLDFSLSVCSITRLSL